MPNDSEALIAELEKVAAGTQSTFGRLSSEQINWKPGTESWSIGQCFEHLIKTNSLFFSELDRISDGTRQSSFLEKYSPLSSFWGNLLINSLKKDSRKFKAPTPKIVPPSEVDAEIIENFVAHQTALITEIKKTGEADWSKIKVTSPFMKIATYRLADGFQIIVEHEKRHFRQAERVLKSQNFPG